MAKKHIRISHPSSETTLAEGPVGWGITPFEGNYYLSRKRLRACQPPWRDALVIVKSDTVLRCHRKGFRLYWRSISTHGLGRSPISEKIQTLIS